MRDYPFPPRLLTMYGPADEQHRLHGQFPADPRLPRHRPVPAPGAGHAREHRCGIERLRAERGPAGGHPEQCAPADLLQRAADPDHHSLAADVAGGAASDCAGPPAALAARGGGRAVDRAAPGQHLLPRLSAGAVLLWRCGHALRHGLRPAGLVSCAVQLCRGDCRHLQPPGRRALSRRHRQAYPQLSPLPGLARRSRTARRYPAASCRTAHHQHRRDAGAPGHGGGGFPDQHTPGAQRAADPDHRPGHQVAVDAFVHLSAVARLGPAWAGHAGRRLPGRHATDDFRRHHRHHGGPRTTPGHGPDWYRHPDLAG